MSTLPDRFHTMMQSARTQLRLTLHRHADHVVQMSAAEQVQHLETIREFVPYPLTDDFSAALPIQEGCELAWSCAVGDAAISGELRLDEFLSVIHSPAPSLDRPEWSDAARQVLSESRVFDDQDYSGNGRMSLLRFTDDGSCEVWFYRQGELFRLSLSYREYLERLCETRGLYDWQLFFADPADLQSSSMLDGSAEATLADLLVALLAVFPETDMAAYRSICQGMRT